VLVDFGSKKNADVAGADAIQYVKNKLLEIQTTLGLPRPTINLMVLTHGDRDHYNMLPALFAAFPADRQLFVGTTVIGGLKAEYTEIATFLNAQQARKLLVPLPSCYHDPANAPAFTFGGDLYGDVRIWMISSNVPNTLGEKNQKSVCLRVEYADRKVILMGDAEAEVEERLLQWYAESPPYFLRCDALKIGHHGSQAGTTTPFLQATQPWAIFASSDQKWAHPYCVTMDRIRAAGFLATDADDHPWLCGQGANVNKQYFNHFNKEAFFTTLAFQTFPQAAMTPEEQSVMMEIEEQFDPDGVLASGLVQGAQYSFRVAPNGNVRIVSTLEGEASKTVVATPTVSLTDEMDGLS
jgi:hypothetical protein